MEPRIAIIFIGTKKYIDFFESYYSSINKFFLPKTHKDFFVFTDQPEHKSLKADNLIITEIEHEEWPYVTLKRFHYILKQEEKLKEYSDIIFIDSDMEAVDEISEDWLSMYHSLFGVQHPGQAIYGLADFETNEESLACVPSGTTNENTAYKQGCFWGGKNPDILEFINLMKQRIDDDLSVNVVARWHDESHLNKGFIDFKDKVTVFHSGFAYPENWEMVFPKLLIHKDKNMKDYPRFKGVK